ncbi:hypothetical protein [Rhizobacter fulvus]
MTGRCRRHALIAAALALGLSATPTLRAQDAGTWEFDPPADTFDPAALLDLRRLNEPLAGATGFVRVGPDGSFVRGDGQPIRFWAVNTDTGHGPFVARPLGPKTAPDLSRHARFLAKRGVNMVRLHRQISPDLAAHPTAAITDIDEAERDSIWRTVAAMRREGIYATISPYWAARMKFAKTWDIAGGAGQAAWGLLFFDETLQTAYRTWLKKLLTEKNPYTGVALAQDPSVALIQLQNEDSLLFWTVDSIQGAQRQALETRFAQFAAGRHGSPEKALAAWAGERAPGDAPEANRLALLPMWQLTQAPPRGGRAARLADQTEFYARTMQAFNARTVDYLKRELGVRPLINAGNWRTASNARLGDAERWSYTAGDVDATNVYTGGLHEGPSNGWAVLNGDRFTRESVLRDPAALPINLRQTQGRSMLVTEGGWVAPNGYGAEGPFLIAAYASLTGIGGYYWFSTGEEGFAPPRSANGYLPSLQKWSFAEPDVLGSFPAAALAYRNGYLKRAAPVVAEGRPLDDLWKRQVPAVVEANAFDPNRDATRTTSGGYAGAVPPTTFLAGPVTVAFGTDRAATSTTGLAGRAAAGIIRASSGQIVMDAARGVCTVDAPMVQGVAAHFAGAPVHQLSDVRFASTNAFGAALAVTLDGLPLARSQQVLVQYATQSRPTGWAQVPVQIALKGAAAVAGWEVKSFGTAPWRVENAQLDVTIRNPALTRATALDMNGMPVAAVALKRNEAQVEFRFPVGTMYVVLR